MQSQEYQVLDNKIESICTKWDEKMDVQNRDISEKFSSINTQLNNHIVHISADISSINTTQKNFSDQITEIKDNLLRNSDKMESKFDGFKTIMMQEIKELMCQNNEDKKNASVNATNIGWLDKFIWIFAGGILTAVVLAATNHLIK